MNNKRNVVAPVNFSNILTRLTTCNGVAIDDHLDHLPQLFNRLIILKGIALMNDRDSVVAVNPKPAPGPSFGGQCYSLNRLYIGDDGMVHVSRDQVGMVSNDNLDDLATNITAIVCG